MLQTSVLHGHGYVILAVSCTRDCQREGITIKSINNNKLIMSVMDHPVLINQNRLM